jgi:hypothetical protein
LTAGAARLPPAARVVADAHPGAAARPIAYDAPVHLSAKFQRVSDVMILDDSPRNVAGKTLKRVLREQYARPEGERRA